MQNKQFKAIRHIPKEPRQHSPVGGTGGNITIVGGSGGYSIPIDGYGRIDSVSKEYVDSQNRPVVNFSNVQDAVNVLKEKMELLEEAVSNGNKNNIDIQALSAEVELRKLQFEAISKGLNEKFDEMQNNIKNKIKTGIND